MSDHLQPLGNEPNRIILVDQIPEQDSEHNRLCSSHRESDNSDLSFTRQHYMVKKQKLTTKAS